MKGLLLWLIVFAAIACNNKNPQNKNTAHTAAKPGTAAVTAYATFMQQLDPAKPESTKEAAEQFAEQLAGADAKDADSAFTFFLRFYQAANDSLNAALLKSKQDYSPLIYASGGPSAELQSFQHNLKQYGFEVRGDAEGKPMINNTWSPVDRWFMPYVSTAMKAYIGQMRMEDQEWLIADGGIVLGAKAFAERIIWWEKFNDQFPDFIRRKYSLAHEERLLTIFLSGMENTPVTYNGQISEYFSTGYEYLLQKYPQSKAAAVVKPYYQALKDGRKQAAEQFLESLTKAGSIIEFSGYNE